MKSPKGSPSRGKRGLGSRALVLDDTRLAALDALDRTAPAASLVQAALAAEREVERDSRTETPSVVAVIEGASAAPVPGARAIQRVPLAEIALEQRRFQYRVTRNLGRLQESLLLHGQQVPVILRGQAPPYEIVSGFGRCDALAAALAQGRTGEAHVWADVRPDLTDREAHEISILENEDRQGLSELDRINKTKKLRGEGYNVSDIASVMKKGERMVQYYLSLAEAPPKITQALTSGTLRPTHALILTKFAREGLRELTPAEVEAKLDELVARCTRGASVSELRSAIAPAPRSNTVFVNLPQGFELRGFRYSTTLPLEVRKGLLAALESARARIAAELDA